MSKRADFVILKNYSRYIMFYRVIYTIVKNLKKITNSLNKLLQHLQQ